MSVDSESYSVDSVEPSTSWGRGESTAEIKIFQHMGGKRKEREKCTFTRILAVGRMLATSSEALSIPLPCCHDCRCSHGKGSRTTSSVTRDVPELLFLRLLLLFLSWGVNIL
jgi:hypothetical protein